MSKLVTFEATVVHETERAVLVLSAETAHQAWVPKSVVEVYPEDDTVTMPENMAVEKELI